MHFHSIAQDTEEDGEEYSSFDVDLGGVQRKELKSIVRSLRQELTACKDKGSLLETQVDVLRKLQKEARVVSIIDVWKLRTLGPAFVAWRALAMASRVAKAHTQQLAIITKAADEKQLEAEQLAARVARVKGNAQNKLTELSEANKQLAAALEQRDAELRGAAAHGQRTAAEVAVLREELHAARTMLAETEHRAQAMNLAKLRAERSAAVLRVELQAALRMLSSVDGEIGSAREALGAAEMRVQRQSAQCEGLQMEIDCFKTEAVAKCVFSELALPLRAGAVCDVHGEAEDDRPMAKTCWTQNDSTSGVWVLGRCTAEEVELRRTRRALLASTFHAWADRIVLFKGVSAEIELRSNAVELEASRAEVDRLTQTLASESSAREIASTKAEALAKSLAHSQSQTEGRVRALMTETRVAAEKHDEYAADSCVRTAVLTGLLRSSELERARLQQISAQLEAQLRRGEEALLALVGQSRQVVERASPRLSRGGGVDTVAD